ncbi:hypothetical protein [[Limnothrix rosea] IAM M-220]|uniref:hypothetical protein n=1 Tax=[Limnothrix rosea] IAM M-220 TaxID=454133 RepID=UPI00095CB561|nr:hypothetical protein [[Limnothrix rosea] IAM M-220]OKH17504.1 hypothetical protein NIES208_09190 [[Limnothrix rosea] IAM M-220]
MSNTINVVNPEQAQRKIMVVLEQLVADYSSFQEEIPIINQEFPADEESFSVVEEIELLTTDLRGYGNQIKYSGAIQDLHKTLTTLKNLPILETPSLFKLYFSNLSLFPKTKQYLQRLDYLKFLLIDWLEQAMKTSARDIKAS